MTCQWQTLPRRKVSDPTFQILISSLRHNIQQIDSKQTVKCMVIACLPLGVTIYCRLFYLASMYNPFIVHKLTLIRFWQLYPLICLTNNDFKFVFGKFDFYDKTKFFRQICSKNCPWTLGELVIIRLRKPSAKLRCVCSRSDISFKSSLLMCVGSGLLIQKSQYRNKDLRRFYQAS